MNNSLLFRFSLIFGILPINFIGCKEEVPNLEPKVWHLNHDDSVMCSRIDKKDTISFYYTDSINNYSKLIFAVKLKAEDIISQSRSQDVDPARNSGSLIFTHSKKYTFFDNTNNFPLVISIFPTFSQTGAIRLNSKFQMRFKEDLVYTRSIYTDGLPLNFILYDSLVYNNKLFTNCNYNIQAYQRNIGLPSILDSTGFPLWLENRSQKIYIDFKP